MDVVIVASVPFLNHSIPPKNRYAEWIVLYTLKASIFLKLKSGKTRGVNNSYREAMSLFQIITERHETEPRAKFICAPNPLVMGPYG